MFMRIDTLKILYEKTMNFIPRISLNLRVLRGFFTAA